LQLLLGHVAEGDWPRQFSCYYPMENDLAASELMALRQKVATPVFSASTLAFSR